MKLAYVLALVFAVAVTTRRIVPKEHLSNRWRKLNLAGHGGRTEYEIYRFSSISMWKSPVYQLNRQYFNPVSDFSARIPTYVVGMEYPSIVQHAFTRAIPVENEDGDKNANDENTEIKTAPSSGPSNCVWAIVSCCSASSTNYHEGCFQQRGCPGPFWGLSPCDPSISQSAAKIALQYYQTNQTRTLMNLIKY